jgi:hypothetical protein
MTTPVGQPFVVVTVQLSVPAITIEVPKQNVATIIARTLLRMDACLV